MYRVLVFPNNANVSIEFLTDFSKGKWKQIFYMKCPSCLVAGVKIFWKEINAWATVQGNTVCFLNNTKHHLISKFSWIDLLYTYLIFQLIEQRVVSKGKHEITHVAVNVEGVGLNLHITVAFHHTCMQNLVACVLHVLHFQNEIFCYS